MLRNKAGGTQLLRGAEQNVQNNEQMIGSTPSNIDGNQQNVPHGTHPQFVPVDNNNPNNPASTTYAEIAGSHSMAIIDQRQPGQMQLLTQERINTINSLLTDIMLSTVESNAELPVFEDTRLHSGAMRLRCANEQTRQWLESNIPTLNAKKLWSGAKLVLMPFKDIPKPHKFNVVFRNINKTPKDIFSLLEKQNKGISTKSWTVLSNVKKNNDTHMTIGVGQDSFDVLRERSNSLFCGMGKATFAIVKGCKENKTMLQQGATDNLCGTNTANTSQQNQNQDQTSSTGDGLNTGSVNESAQPMDPEQKQ